MSEAAMPPEVDQQTLPLFIRRTAALAEIEAEETPRPIEFDRIFYFALRTPGIAWPTDQNGKIDKDKKSIRSGMSLGEFLTWLPAGLGLLCIDCGSHCYPNCKSAPKKHSRRNRRKRCEQPASALADPQNQSRFTVTEADRLYVVDMYRPIFAKIRRKRRSKRNEQALLPGTSEMPAPPRKPPGRPRKLTEITASEPAA